MATERTRARKRAPSPRPNAMTNEPAAKPKPPKTTATKRRRRRGPKLPPNIRRHHDGYRAVIRVGDDVVRSKTVATVEEAERLRDTMKRWKPSSRVFTLDDGITLLRDDLRRKATSAGTTRFYEASYAILRAAWPGETPLVRIDAPAIERWLDIRRDVHKVSASTAHKNAAVLRRIFRLAVRRRRDTGIVENPLDEITMPTPRAQRFGYLTDGEVRSIVERVRATKPTRQAPRPEWDADVIEALFLTGLRRAEMARLRVADVDVFRGRLHVRGKTGDRTLPIVAPLKPVLLRLIDDADADGYLIPARSESADSRATQVDRALRRWRERFKKPNLHPHALRHSFGTWHVRSGTPPHVLRELLGHQTLQMTMRYYHADGKEAHAAMERMARAFTGEVDDAADAKEAAR